MVARYDHWHWELRHDEMVETASRTWDWAEAVSWAAGYDFKDRHGRWVRPNPERQQGLVELVMELYEGGLKTQDFVQPVQALD